MTWNYRIIEQANEHGDRWRAIHEVYYDDEGKPRSYTVDAVGVQWDVEEGDDAGLRTLDQMREAFTLPVLRPEDFTYASLTPEEEDAVTCLRNEEEVLAYLAAARAKAGNDAVFMARARNCCARPQTVGDPG